MSKKFALSTSDNKWNPITNFNEWYEYDQYEAKYETCRYLALIANPGKGVSNEEYSDEVERAIDDIVKRNLIGIETGFKVNYIKVEAE